MKIMSPYDNSDNETKHGTNKYWCNATLRVMTLLFIFFCIPVVAYQLPTFYDSRNCQIAVLALPPY